MRLALFYNVLRAALGQPFCAADGAVDANCATDAAKVAGEACATGANCAVDDAGAMENLSPEDCKFLFAMAKRQSLLGLVYDGAKKLGVQLPRELALNWLMRVEAIRGYNGQMNFVAVRLTQMFESLGCRSAILKGQANARLYPDPSARQPGDIDIWVSGGKASVLKLLQKQGLMEGASVSEIHAHLAKERFGVDVEVHFVPCGCNYNPFADRRMQNFLLQELDRAELVPDGFYAPSLRFAMVMQLSHIRRHFFGMGIGLRQLVDYFVLICNSAEADREAVRPVIAAAGLSHIAGAAMYVLREVLGLEESQMLCMPDVKRGKVLLREILEDGNFGNHAKRKRGSVFMWWLKNRLRVLRLLGFDFNETLWLLLRYWGGFVFLIPMRISIFRNFVQRRRNAVRPEK